MTTLRQSVSLWAPRVTDVLRAARARIPYGQRQSDRYVKGLSKRTLSDDRCKCVEQITAFVIDLAHRGDLHDAESIGNALRGVARSEYERTHPVAQLTLADAWSAEQEAEGQKNVAEIAFFTQPTEANEQRFHAAKLVHDIADERLADAVRREVMRRLHQRPLYST